MDGDSGDEGNDELTCVRSDESDKSSWSAGRRSSLGNKFKRQGDAWWKERLLTFREEEEGGRERVTTSEERVLRLGWRLRLCMWEKWFMVCAFIIGPVRASGEINKKLIARWDSERELFYDYTIQNLLSNKAEVYNTFIMVKLDLQLNLKITMSKVML